MKKYRITILNALGWLLFVYGLISIAVFIIKRTGAGGEAWSAVIAISLGVTGFVLLVVDFLVQVIGHKRKLSNYLGVSLILFAIFYFIKEDRYKTIVIPDNFRGYATVVYNVKDHEPLYKSKLNLGYDVILPSNGIIFTSTTLEDDIWQTKFVTISGKELRNSDSEKSLYATTFENGDYQCNLAKWQFRTWLVDYRSSWNKKYDTDTVSIESMRKKCEVN